jgi:hypothetical protein
LLPAAELLSFLKQAHGTWTERDVQVQGYAEPIARTQKWRTSEAGLTVSGAKTAPLTRKAVDQALSALRDRIQAINSDKKADYTVSEAVAFGDFLTQDARVQPAEVGIRLTSRNTDVDASASAVEHKAEQAFLEQLRGTSAAVHIQPYASQEGRLRGSYARISSFVGFGTDL